MNFLPLEHITTRRDGVPRAVAHAAARERIHGEILGVVRRYDLMTP